MKELFLTASAWAIGAGIGQLLLIPIDAANTSVWCGIVVGATSQKWMEMMQRTNGVEAS